MLVLIRFSVVHKARGKLKTGTLTVESPTSDEFPAEYNCALFTFLRLYIWQHCLKLKIILRAQSYA
jgi:hypothetical protein